MVNILRVEGAENEGIHYLRAFGNSDAIRADAEAAEHVVLIGGSYIGAEVAASLTAQGDEVHDRDDGGRGALADLRRGGRPLVPASCSSRRASTIHGGEELEAFEGDGRVKAVVTKSGLAVECDTVVVGAGVRPDAMLAQRAGLEVDDGIVCDSKLQTSVEGIYAAGDCCSYDSVVHGRRLRVEHWDVAMQQGMHAAAEHARRRTPTTRSSPTSSATSPTGRASSTSGRPTSGTRRSGAATARPASSRSGT